MKGQSAKSIASNQVNSINSISPTNSINFTPVTRNKIDLLLQAINYELSTGTESALTRNSQPEDRGQMTENRRQKLRSWEAGWLGGV
jgi:hypothetical protein